MRRLSLVTIPLLVAVAACSATGPGDPGPPKPSVLSSPDPGTSPSAEPASGPSAGPTRDLPALATALDVAVKENRGLVVSMMGYVGQGDGGATAAVGVAQRKPRRAVRADDTVMVLSLTKAVVATTVMSLAEDDELSLNDTVEQWLPGLVDRGEEITVEMLLSMTSGLASYDTAARYPGGGQLPARRLVALNQSLDEPLTTEPGVEGNESNTNYVLLGLVIEEVTGRPFADVVRERVLKPAGMAHSAFGGAPAVHGYDGSEDVTIIDPPFSSAAAGLVTTVGDLGAFLAALVGGRLLEQSTFLDMSRDRAQVDGDRYGLGLRMRDTGTCGEIVGQVGGGSGESATAWISPSTGRVVVVSADLTGAGLAQAVVDELICD